MTKRCNDCRVEVQIFKNDVGGAVLYCESCDKVPETIRERFHELRLSLFNQYPKAFRNLRDGIKESFSFSHRYKGFTIVFSSVFD